MLLSGIDAVYYRDGASILGARFLMRRAREEMFSRFMQCFKLDRSSRVLDIGVSDEENGEANILEKLYPYPDRLTCAGLGDGRMVLSSYPGIEYVKILAGKALPFGDGAFDVVYSNAVLEHVGGKERRQRFIQELLRVGKGVFLTVPNRWFPLEHHTGIPFLHFNAHLFRSALKSTSLNHWSDPVNLEFLDKRTLAAEWPDASAAPEFFYTGIKLGPFSSNIAIAARHE